MLEAVRYRSANPRDATAIAELIASGFGTYREFAPGGWQPRTAFQEAGPVYDRLARGDTHARLALAEAALAGFTGWMPARTPPPERVPIPGRGHLWSLFVARAWWGTGLATTLLDWAVTTMRDSGLESAQLWTPSASSRARAFYEREGWRPGGDTVFNPDLKLTLVLYERGL